VGRLAKPRFEIKLNGSIGFDDNIFQTPTHAREVPEQVIRVQTTAGTEDQIILVPVPVRQGPTPIGSPIRPAPASPRFNTVFVPGTDPQFEEIVIPGLPKPKRKASAISRASLGVQVQTATRRSVFTLDLNVNEDYYWNRPKQKEEHNGGLAVLFLHRFTPRLQVTAAVNAAYLSQPDLSQINTPTRTGAGSYLNLTSKFDLAYRWAPRFSTVSSLSYNQLSFEEKLRQTGNYQAYLLGTELRYLWSPRLTAVVEGRYGATWYPENPSLDSVSYFALIGLDIAVSRRAGATLRLGGSTRVFDETGKKSTAPYLETTLNYALGRASVLRLNGRFGFEEPPDPNTEVLSFRTGVNVTHFFTPRLSTALAINAIHRTSTNDIADIETTEDTLDTTLALEYTLSRHWSFNLNYSYTTVFDDPGNSDYFRNRLFTGFDYEF
jgi:hypothetical protein